MATSVAELWELAHALMVTDGAAPVKEKINVGVLGKARLCLVIERWFRW